MNHLRIRLDLLLVAFVLAGAVGVARADISMRINRVGPFSGSPFWVRDGVVTFAEVDVRNSGSAPFDGVLRASQTDRDGDVVVSELSIAVAPDGEWESKELYFVPNLASGDSYLTIKLYTPEDELVEFTNDVGETTKSLRSNPFMDKPDKDDLLIVAMSSGVPLPHDSCLRATAQDLSFTEVVTDRAIRSIAPREIPRKAQGLNAIDAIIWEDADPGEITPDQADSLIGWVRQGGRLLITANSHWQSFANSPLAEIMPASIVDIEDVHAIPAFKGIIVTRSEYEEFASGYRAHAITRCSMQPKADALGIPSNVKPDDDNADADAPQDLSPIAYRRYVGRGMVTLLGAKLMDLMPPPAVAEFDNSDEAKAERVRFAKMVDKVVANNFLALPPFREAKGNTWGLDQKTNLFTALTQTIGFSTVTGVFLVFAIGFTCIYTFVATIGSYLYLNKKGWASYCWSAFAAVSIVGVVIGLGMVWVLRGFSTKVWETSVVDAHAGKNYGYATCLFGVKTKDHTRLDLQLPVGYTNAPSGNGLIYALPKTFDPMLGSESSFVASETYRLTQAATHIDGVPVRATLKEFEGRWHGELGGTLEARLIYDDTTNQFTADSYIRNELGITLSDCYLIEGDQDIAGERGSVIGIRCHTLNALEAKGDGSETSGERFVRLLYEKEPAGPDGKPVLRKPIEMRLSTYLGSWLGSTRSFSSLIGQGTQAADIPADAAHAPFLLLSVYNLIDPTNSPGASWKLKRSYGRRLDCSDWVTKHTAVLIGFSHDTPPALLQIDRVNERPQKALTMYRFLIPVERK